MRRDARPPSRAKGEPRVSLLGNHFEHDPAAVRAAKGLHLAAVGRSAVKIALLKNHAAGLGFLSISAAAEGVEHAFGPAPGNGCQFPNGAAPSRNADCASPSG